MGTETLDMTPWNHRKRERLDGLPLDDYAPGASVLDIGCNRGLIGYHLASKGARLVHGCDINERAIATARHLFEDVNCESYFAVVDLTKPGALLTFGMEYDIVVMSGVYHKLERQMTRLDLDDLVCKIAIHAGDNGVFAWNSFPHHFDEVDKLMRFIRRECVHQVEVRGSCNAIWRRRTSEEWLPVFG